MRNGNADIRKFNTHRVTKNMTTLFGKCLRTGTFAVLAGLLLAGPAVAENRSQPPSPKAEAAVEQLTTHALNVMRDSSLDTAGRRESLARLLRRELDVQTIADFVMGQHGQTLSDAERARFRSVFGDYVVSTYARLLAQQRVEDIEVTGSRTVTHKTAAVSTRVIRDSGTQTSWTWRLHRRDGTYQLVDLQTEGVSLAVTYRSKLGSALGREQLDGVLRRLRDQSAMGDLMRFEKIALNQLLRDFNSAHLALTVR